MPRLINSLITSWRLTAEITPSPIWAATTLAPTSSRSKAKSAEASKTTDGMIRPGRRAQLRRGARQGIHRPRHRAWHGVDRDPGRAVCSVRSTSIGLHCLRAKTLPCRRPPYPKLLSPFSEAPNDHFAPLYNIFSECLKILTLIFSLFLQ